MSFIMPGELLKRGRGGGLYDRDDTMERNEWNSDDEEFDEFGRRRKGKKRPKTPGSASQGSTTPQASEPSQSSRPGSALPQDQKQMQQMHQQQIQQMQQAVNPAMRSNPIVRRPLTVDQYLNQSTVKQAYGCHQVQQSIDARRSTTQQKQQDLNPATDQQMQFMNQQQMNMGMHQNQQMMMQLMNQPQMNMGPEQMQQMMQHMTPEEMQNWMFQMQQQVAKSQLPTPVQLPARLKKIPCKYYPSGCSRGTTCAFLHNPALLKQQAAPKEAKVVFAPDQFINFETGKKMQYVPLPSQPIGSEDMPASLRPQKEATGSKKNDTPNMDDALAELLSM